MARLIAQFRALEARAATVVPAMRANAEYAESLERQYDVLSAALFGAGTTPRVATDIEQGE